MSEVFPGLHRPSQPVHADIVVGLGARVGASTHDVVMLIDTVLAQYHLFRSNIAALATLDRKLTDAAIQGAASMLGVPLVGLGADDLDRPVPNPSRLVWKHVGLTSVAEAAASHLGALIAPKARSANVTCALSRLFPAQPMIAASASSTLSTSSAGP